jgi:catechol 2,3-dioxygenase-like lactoylglutathione lyase family enzyme
MEVAEAGDSAPMAAAGLHADPTASTKRSKAVLRRRAAVGDDLCIILDQPERPTGAGPSRFGDLGVHHVGFWIEDTAALERSLEAAGIDVLSVRESSGDNFGVAPKQRFVSLFVHDPDGTILQLDQALD